MRVVIQRVTEANIIINKLDKRSISGGLVVLLGIEETDTKEDADWLSAKIVRLRIFPDEKGVMNLPLNEIGGDILVVSQFTLHAKTKKGNRPSYIRAASPETAIPLYNYFVETIAKEENVNIVTGEFGADMQIELINDGPVTIWIDTKNKE